MPAWKRVTALDKQAFVQTLSFFKELGLVSEGEIGETMSMFDPAFALAAAMAAAESVHLHIKVTGYG